MGWIDGLPIDIMRTPCLICSFEKLLLLYHQMYSWEMTGCAKVCLKVPTAEELYEIRRLAKEAGLITYVVVRVYLLTYLAHHLPTYLPSARQQDAGWTKLLQVGEPCLAIGPSTHPST